MASMCKHPEETSTHKELVHKRISCEIDVSINAMSELFQNRVLLAWASETLLTTDVNVII